MVSTDAIDWSVAMQMGGQVHAITYLDTGGLQFAALQAHWGFGTKHDGERYELHLCENCFFGTVAYLKQERRIQNLFDQNDQTSTADDFGLIARDDFFGDSH